MCTGNNLDYPSWKGAFSTLIENHNIPPNERVHYLQRYLGGDALRCVKSFLLMPSEDSYYEAMNLIDSRFGDLFAIAQAFKSKIETWPKIGLRDAVGLRKFSDFLRQCEVAARTNLNLRILEDDVQNKSILSKLSHDGAGKCTCTSLKLRYIPLLLSLYHSW